MIPNPLLAWPVKFSATSYVLRVDVDGTPEDLPFPASGTLDTDRYYWITGDGQADAAGGVGGVGDLLGMLVTALQAHSLITTATVVFDTSDFTVDVSITGGTAVTLLWSHGNTTLDATLFGWTQAADSAAGGTVSSPNSPQGLWRPRRPATTDSRERPRIVGGQSRAVSGRSRTSNFSTPGQEPRERELGFVRVFDRYILAESAVATEPYAALETAWIGAWGLGYPLRHFPDETDVSDSNAYTLYELRSLEHPYKRAASFNLRWDVDLELERVQ